MREARTALPEHNLDLLRSVAVLGVLADHTTAAVGLGSAFTQWLGLSGVLAFFVHTSLVLMSSLERDDAPQRPLWFLRFYVRRALRIYPLAWAVLVIVLVLHVPPASFKTHFHPESVATIVANFALVQNLVGASFVFTVMWTLPLELQMYAILPLCFLVARRPSRLWIGMLVAAGLALAALYLRTFEGPSRLPSMWRLGVLSYGPCFLMGVFAYWTLRRRAGAAAPLPSWIWPFIVLGNIGAIWLVREQLHGYYWILRYAFCAILGLTIPMVREPTASFVTRMAHTVATYSYGIYLLHLLALRVGFGLLRERPMAVQALVAFAVLVSSCWVAYHLVERPGILLGQRLLRVRGKALSLEATAPAP